MTSLEDQFISSQKESKDNKEENCESEIIEQLKIKFVQTVRWNENITILSVLSQNWTCKKIKQDYGVTNYMAWAIKKLVCVKGVISTPNPKPGKTLMWLLQTFIKRMT